MRSAAQSGPIRNPGPFIVSLTTAILLLWSFPNLWCLYGNRGEHFLWLVERQDIPGWHFLSVPISDVAQAELGSDYFFNGEYTNSVHRVRAFSAKTYGSSDDVQAFAHNPDRCWPLVGWKLKLLQPEVVCVRVAGIPIQFERRCFESSGSRELVYFGALVDGEPLPYRLDQYLSFGLTVNKTERSGTIVRGSDFRFWGYVWHAFLSRRSLKGPKHFIRISTPLSSYPDLASADQTLQEFLNDWLWPGDFHTEQHSSEHGVSERNNAF